MVIPIIKFPFIFRLKYSFYPKNLIADWLAFATASVTRARNQKGQLKKVITRVI